MSSTATQCSRRSTRSGATEETYSCTASQASAPETTRRLTSSLKMSRTTLIARSGSLLSRVGGEAVWARALMSSHWACSRCTSCSNASSAAPSAAVRTMTPAPSGMTRFRIPFSLVRSVSGSLRLMPVIEPSGT